MVSIGTFSWGVYRNLKPMPLGRQHRDAGGRWWCGVTAHTWKLRICRCLLGCGCSLPQNWAITWQWTCVLNERGPNSTRTYKVYRVKYSSVRGKVYSSPLTSVKVVDKCSQGRCEVRATVLGHLPGRGSARQGCFSSSAAKAPLGKKLNWHERSQCHIVDRFGVHDKPEGVGQLKAIND